MEGKMGKKTLKGRVGKTTTVISDLPESALHHILSYLPARDSVRTSVLSKQWDSARKSNPFLDFKQPEDMYDTDVASPEFKERLREFLNFVDRSLQHFDQNKLCIERMHLQVFGVEQESVPLISTWLPLALNSGVSDLHFLVSLDSGDSIHPLPESTLALCNGVSDIEVLACLTKGLIYPLPESTFTVNSSLFSGSFKFFRLEKLTLDMVSLSESVLRDIIRNCPNITHLSLKSIEGLETLNISKLDKLVSLQVLDYGRRIKSLYVNALSLEHSSFLFSGEEFDLTSCCNLREIKLNGSSVSDAQFHQLISKFPLLEFLEIFYCHGFQRIKISLQRLKRLRVYFCDGVKAIEIDAPTLSCFEFRPSSENVLISVSSKVVRCSMYLSCDLQYPHSSWSLIKGISRSSF